MKGSSMPTADNTNEVESYSDYKAKQFSTKKETLKALISSVSDSSLTIDDKKLLLIDLVNMVDIALHISIKQ